MAALLIVEDDRKTNEAICEYLKLFESSRHQAAPGAPLSKGGSGA